MCVCGRVVWEFWKYGEANSVNVQNMYFLYLYTYIFFRSQTERERERAENPRLWPRRRRSISAASADWTITTAKATDTRPDISRSSPLSSLTPSAGSRTSPSSSITPLDSENQRIASTLSGAPFATPKSPSLTASSYGNDVMISYFLSVNVTNYLLKLLSVSLSLCIILVWAWQDLYFAILFPSGDFAMKWPCLWCSNILFLIEIIEWYQHFLSAFLPDHACSLVVPFSLIAIPNVHRCILCFHIWKNKSWSINLKIFVGN